MKTSLKSGNKENKAFRKNKERRKTLAIMKNEIQSFAKDVYIATKAQRLKIRTEQISRIIDIHS